MSIKVECRDGCLTPNIANKEKTEQDSEISVERDHVLGNFYSPNGYVQLSATSKRQVGYLSPTCAVSICPSVTALFGCYDFRPVAP